MLRINTAHLVPDRQLAPAERATVSAPEPPHGWIGQFDGLRFLAAFSVIATDYAMQTSFDPAIHNVPFAPFLQILSLANIGVIFFYGLSGFLLSHLAAQEFRATGRFDPLQFYFRRCLRIVPLYLACVLVGLAIPQTHIGPYAQCTGPSAWVWSRQNWLLSTFTSNWGQSLAGIDEPFMWAPYVKPGQSPLAWLIVIFAPTVTGLLIALSLWWVIANPDIAFCRFLRHPVTRALGRCSYGIYMWHMQVQYLADEIDAKWVATLPVSLQGAGVVLLFIAFVLMTIVAAATSYVLIERPALSLKLRLDGRRRSIKHVAPSAEPPVLRIAAAALGGVFAAVAMLILMHHL
jgi:peptidoglycan/LPS O-acetylase OafA/YrhL